jgi:S-formylglutathione hydrolase FrmB
MSTAGLAAVGNRPDAAQQAGAQVAAAAAAAATRAGAPRIPAPARPTGPGRIVTMTLAAPGESSPDRAVFVYRPAVADSATLPVVYFLHGVPGGPGDVFAAGLANYLNQAFLRGVAPFVVVAPDGNGASHDDTEWADAWDGSDRMESFVMDVVIPAVEGPNRRDAAHRAIAGDSMGGYGAMNLAMRHPGLFGQVVTIAGYFHVDDPAGMFGGQPALIAANSPDLHPAEAAGLRVLLIDGTDESDPVIIGESQRMSTLLGASGVANDLVLLPGDDTYTFVASQFARITTFVDAGW